MSEGQSAGLAALIAASIAGAVEILRAKRAPKKKHIEPPPNPVAGLAAHVGSLSQKMYDMESRMMKLSESLDKLADSVDEVLLSNARVNTELTVGLRHLKEQVEEIKNELKEKEKRTS